MIARASLISGQVAFLLLIGLSEPVGILAGIPLVRALGRLTAASNAPLVFNQIGGIEFWANRYRFEFHGRDGSEVQLPVTSEVLSQIRGPHTRTAAYVVAIGLGLVVGPDLYLRPLQFGLCGRGALAKDFGYSGELSKAIVQVESGSPHDGRKWELVVTCPL